MTRLLTLALLALVMLIQYPLWFGKGGWTRVWELDRQLADQQARNEALAARNDAIDAEVRDLKHGLDAVEERARVDLGFVRQDEVYFQVVEPRR
jgi:cell division protein FtsB